MNEINTFWQLIDSRLKSVESTHFIARVKSVNQEERSCVVAINDKVSYEDVRLFSVLNPELKGFFVIPKVDSLVMVSRIGNSNELFVGLFSEIDKIAGSIGEKLEVSFDEKGLQYMNDKVKCTISDELVECVNDKVTLSIKDNKVSVVGADEITFNEGKNGGLCITPTLTQELEKNNEILQGILQIFTGGSILEPGNGAASALQMALKAVLAGKKIGNFSTIENQKVKH